MKQFAQLKGSRFPTCMTRTRTAARAYGAVCTPDFFVFDASGTAHRGRLDPGHQPAAQGRPPIVEAMRAIAERQMLRAAASIRGLLHQVEGGLRHEAERKRMREPQALITAEQLAVCSASRTSGSTTARPISSRRPPAAKTRYIAVSGPQDVRGRRTSPAPTSACRASSPTPPCRSALHDAGATAQQLEAAFGRPRPRQAALALVLTASAA